MLLRPFLRRHAMTSSTFEHLVSGKLLPLLRLFSLSFAKISTICSSIANENSISTLLTSRSYLYPNRYQRTSSREWFNHDMNIFPGTRLLIHVQETTSSTLGSPESQEEIMTWIFVFVDGTRLISPVSLVLERTFVHPPPLALVPDAVREETCLIYGYGHTRLGND